MTIQLPPPDTHCEDLDTGKDVWSYSRALAEKAVSDAIEALERDGPEIELGTDANGSPWRGPMRTALQLAQAAATAEAARGDALEHEITRIRSWISVAQAELDGVEVAHDNNCLSAAQGALSRAMAPAIQQEGAANVTKSP